jgi:hypothetical protein
MLLRLVSLSCLLEWGGRVLLLVWGELEKKWWGEGQTMKFESTIC